MPQPLSRLPARKLLLICALIAIAATIAVAIKARRSAPAAAAQEKEQGERLEVEYVTLTRAGFEPAEITRPRGRFLLAVNNRTRLESIEVQLEREAGGRLRGARIPSMKRDWRERVALPPGRYLLTEAGHPGWKCLITITLGGD